MSPPHHRSCLSTEPHTDNINDFLSHFTGCADISERSRLLSDDTHPVWLYELQHHIESGKTDDEAERLMKEKRQNWKEIWLSELRRIEFLREKLKNDEKEMGVVSNVEQSGNLWRQSDEYRNGLDLVRKWKKTTEYLTDLQERNDELSHFGDFQKAVELVENWKKRPDNTGTSETSDDILDSLPKSVTDAYKPEKDISVPILRFKNGHAQDVEVLEKVDGRNVWGSFPNQMTTMEHLLDRSCKQRNILCRERADISTIKYFHLPSNNMTFAEEAIARCFNEERPELQTFGRKSKKTRSSLVLDDSRWRGRFIEGLDSPESRFLRPISEAFSSSTAEEGHSAPQDFVLFMPYLHWETSRNREKFGQQIEQIVDNHHTEGATAEVKAKKLRIEARKLLHPELGHQASNETSTKSKIRQDLDKLANSSDDAKSEIEDDPQASGTDTSTGGKPVAAVRRILSLEAVAQSLDYSKIPVKVDNTGRLRVTYKDQNGNQRGSLLGQYLLDAARMFEAVTTYRDKRLYEKYIMHNPPLHPRRTLDRAYHRTLNAIRSRDQDQVVYRATTVKGSHFHNFDVAAGLWPKHETLRSEKPCRDCSDKIRKVSRMIMVDQLWMWILDANTIITCFPDRYGAKEHQNSGIHSSIRSKVVGESFQQVQSVFDLALIILEECSSTFFDHASGQPDLLETFSEAIERIMHKQRLAFERLNRWMQVARMSNGPRARTASLNLVDVTLEVALETQIRDIVEELGIMMYVKKNNQDILKGFIRHVNETWNNQAHEASRDGIDVSRRQADDSASSREQYMPPRPTPDGQRGVGMVENIDRFNLNAEKVLTHVNEHIERLAELQSRAEITAANVANFLGLKQQQAGVIQAWKSSRQSDEANEQGRAIMVFTIVTTIFLPLSFMSSLFGMNTKEFGGDDNVMHLVDQFRYIFGLSAPVITLILVFALTKWKRITLTYYLKYIFLLFLSSTGIYQAYLYISQPMPRRNEIVMDRIESLLDQQSESFFREKWKHVKYGQRWHKNEGKGRIQAAYEGILASLNRFKAVPRSAGEGESTNGGTQRISGSHMGDVHRQASELDISPQRRPAMLENDLEAGKSSAVYRFA